MILIYSQDWNSTFKVANTTYQHVGGEKCKNYTLSLGNYYYSSAKLENRVLLGRETREVREL